MVFENNFIQSFSKFGFESVEQNNGLIVAFSQGKNVGVYLTIKNDTFSIETVYDFMTQKIFYWQHFENYKEIEDLIIKNHILSEQLCEKFGGAVYT